uniref:Uncharacterized protein n=1 Tax=Picea glauca TaxID=3330 RepID=A0A101LVS4_PICGL|nr:hypothetical protein ABT39_MTgene1762 [Picea glauca]QHR88405.1 hypothetical protein Q903MT_gene2418 [Picea sitchensis]
MSNSYSLLWLVDQAYHMGRLEIHPPLHLNINMLRTIHRSSLLPPYLLESLLIPHKDPNLKQRGGRATAN